MSYTDKVEYDFKDPRVYMPADPDDLEATAKDKYLTDCYNIGDGVAIDRYKAVKVSGGVASEIATETPSATNKSKYATAQDWNQQLSCEAALGEWKVAGTATKYYAPTALHTVSSSSLSLYQTKELTSTDFAGDGLKLKVVFDGKSYFDAISAIFIEPSDSGDESTFDEGEDYAGTISFSKVDDHDEATITVTVTPNSALSTYLQTKGVKVTVNLRAVTETVMPYTYSYVPHQGGAKTDLIVLPTPPAGYSGVVANLVLTCKQYTYAECAGISQETVPATGPRKVAVWTSGTFRQADIPNYQAAFNSDNMAFI